MKNALLALTLILTATHAHAFDMTSVDGTLVDLNSDQDEILTTVTGLEAVPADGDFVSDVPANLKILGKGILDTDRNVSLAVACVGKPQGESTEADCSQLRVVEFDANRIPHWEGNAFTIKSTKAFQVSLKKEYRKKFRIHFLKVKKDPNRTDNVGKVVALSTVIGGAIFEKYINAVIIPALGGGFGAYLILVSPWLLLGVMALCHVDVLAGPVNLVMAPFRGLGNAMVMDGSNSMTASNGWNWAQKPTEVSQKKYEKIKSLLADFASGAISEGK